MPIARTGDQVFIREINLSIILNTLRTAGPLSRASLAAKTGLNKTTVSSLVTELVGARFVRERGFRSSSTGRPGMLLELNPNAGCIVAAEIGVDFISVILANFNAEVVWRHQEEQTVSYFRRFIGAAWAQAREQKGGPQIPSWNRVTYSVPDIYKVIVEAVEEDNP